VRDRKTNVEIYEDVPSYVRVGMKILFASPLINTKFARSQLAEKSKKKGIKYNSPESAKEIPKFISTYKINIAEFMPSTLDGYKTYNEFFYRKIRPELRPVAEPNNPKVLVSGADCRLAVFKSVEDATSVWIKGKNFNLAGLLGSPQLAEKFKGGSIALFRLAPQDYHRFHSPVDGKVLETNTIEGQYYTVNPMAVCSDLDVFTENKRAVSLIESKEFGLVAHISVGAAMVGSINFTGMQKDAQVKRGDDLGYFAFGGSTVALVFQKDRVVFDDDLVKSSMGELETIVKVNERIGMAAPGGKTGQK